VFLLLLFCIILVQTLGTVISFVWVYDSYGLSTSGGSYTTLGQLDQETPTTTRSGLEAIDDVLDESMQQIESYMCNAYKKCCYTLAHAAATTVARQTVVASCRGTSAVGSACEFQCEIPGSSVSTCQKGSLAQHCPSGCNYTSADHQQDFTCVAAHNGAGVGAAANVLRDPSNKQFCSALTGHEGKEFIIPGAACHAMDKAGITNLTHCQESYCKSGVSGFEIFMSNTFQWIQDKIVPIAVMCGVLGLLEACQFCVCMGMLCASSEKLGHGLDGLKDGLRRSRKESPPRHHDPGYNRKTRNRTVDI